MAPYGFATARGRITLVSLRALKGNTSACFIFFDLKKKKIQLIWQVGNRYFTYVELVQGNFSDRFFRS